jgi:DNA-binding protein YbaB
MFNKLKQFKDLRTQAKTMQDALSTERVSEEKGGVKITMNGNMEVLEVNIESGMTRESIEMNVKGAVNETIKKAQRLMAKKLQDMGGFPGLN